MRESRKKEKTDREKKGRKCSFHFFLPIASFFLSLNFFNFRKRERKKRISDPFFSLSFLFFSHKKVECRILSLDEKGKANQRPEFSDRIVLNIYALDPTETDWPTGRDWLSGKVFTVLFFQGKNPGPLLRPHHQRVTTERGKKFNRFFLPTCKGLQGAEKCFSFSHSLSTLKPLLLSKGFERRKKFLFSPKLRPQQQIGGVHENYCSQIFL